MLGLLSSVLTGSALAQTAPQELLTAKTVHLSDRSSDRKLFGQIREQVKQWGRWEEARSARNADLVLVLTVEQKWLEKIPLKSLEEPHATQADEEYELRTLTARNRLAEFAFSCAVL
ncbi:MAG: hypothetical protein L0312_01420 [Acidobacteria bacterium]|nr:hypothetical protein [Acidobacteriota bacterium]